MPADSTANRLTLVFLVDALGYEQARDPSYLGFLDAPRTPVRSALGYSSSCIPSLLSGRRPDEHGHLSMYRRDPGDGVFRHLRGILPLAARLGRGDWRIRQWIARDLKRRGITGYFSLYDVPLEWLPRFDLCQRRNLFEPGAFSDGAGLADLLRESGLPHRIWHWERTESEAFAELEAEIERVEATWLLLYTAELDSTMHAAGPGGARTAEKLRALEERIDAVCERARRRYDQVDVFVFGDHGMAPVERHVDLWAELRKLPHRAGKDYLYFLDSTMARFWFDGGAARRDVMALLGATDYGRVLEEDELRRLGAWFEEDDYGEVLFLVEEGTILVPSFMGKSGVRGMHGYHPDDRHSHTTLVTNRRDVEPPEDLTGIFRILRRQIEEARRR